MKAIFPCRGSVILTKVDADKLRNFYLNNLEKSKLFNIYNQSNYSIQEGNLTYLPKKSNIIAEDIHFLTLKNLHTVLSKELEKNPGNYTVPNSHEPLDDNFIINHPFFSTLTPLN